MNYSFSTNTIAYMANEALREKNVSSNIFSKEDEITVYQYDESPEYIKNETTNNERYKDIDFDKSDIWTINKYFSYPSDDEKYNEIFHIVSFIEDKDRHVLIAVSYTTIRNGEETVNFFSNEYIVAGEEITEGTDNGINENEDVDWI